MRLQDESAALETLAKKVLQYFIAPGTGHTAVTHAVTILQTICDDLNNHYFFTRPYQYLSGNSKAVEELAALKEMIQTVASKDVWSIDLAFSVVQIIYEFLNVSDWQFNGVNNKLTIALCLKMQDDLQIDPAISLVELQNLLQGKNGKIFTAELENALGKAITQNKKLKVDQLAVAKNIVTVINQTYLDDFGFGACVDQPMFMHGSQTSPLIFSPVTGSIVGWFGLTLFTSKLKSTLDSMTEESDEEQEYEHDSGHHSFNSLMD